ncbi:DNA topoisomerase, partial [Pseudomonas sp. JG-B]|uniref:DNA topoisomerase n=1 Tax=Pseudomonas sp. JG-B TaxID=2603214 RepID=UPI00129E56FA
GALLVERDKEKEGESGGIGTPATRDTHIENLFERGYFMKDGDYVVSTQAARDFYAALPDYAKLARPLGNLGGTLSGSGSGQFDASRLCEGTGRVDAERNRSTESQRTQPQG